MATRWVWEIFDLIRNGEIYETEARLTDNVLDRLFPPGDSGLHYDNFHNTGFGTEYHTYPMSHQNFGFSVTGTRIAIADIPIDQNYDVSRYQYYGSFYGYSQGSLGKRIANGVIRITYEFTQAASPPGYMYVVRLVSGTPYDVLKRTTYSKGQTSQGFISSANSSAYPANSYKNNNWYVRKGSDNIDPQSISYPSNVTSNQPITITIVPSDKISYGGSIKYDLQAKINNQEWVDIKTNVSETTINYTPTGIIQTIQFRTRAKDNLGFVSTDWIEGSVSTSIPLTTGLRQRLHRKNAEGTYDVVYFESAADITYLSDGRTVEQAIIDIEGRLSSL